MPDTSKGALPVPGERMPTPPKVAAILLAVLAALLLINAVLSFAGLDAIIDQFAEAADEQDGEFDRAAVRGQLLLNIGGSVVVGLVAAASVVLLARRMPAGRWLGLGCAAIQLILTILIVIAVGGILIYSLLFIVITAAIIVMLFRRQTLDWLRPATTR